MQNNKDDLARFLGRANVGSAFEVIENSDFVCIINRETKKSTGQLFLTFKRIKIRYKEISDLGYINHPFADDNKMQLLDDINLDHSLSEDSLATEFEGIDLNAKKGKRSAKEREIVEDDDLFDFSKSISSKN